MTRLAMQLLSWLVALSLLASARASVEQIRNGLLAARDKSASRSRRGSTKCIKRTVRDKFTHFDSNIWTLDAGNANQLTYSHGLNMTLSQGSDNIVLATRKQWLPPVTATFSVLASDAPGIVSPLIWRGDGDGTDELDLEFVGGNPQSIQTVLWRLGKRVSFDLSDVDNFNREQYHTFRLSWTKTAFTMSIDGQLIRTMQKPQTAGSNWPSGAQPLNFKMGPWASMSPEWAGTLDWQANPSPVMSLKGLTISGCASS